MEPQRGVWKTAGPCSCRATRWTPPRTCCSGSWKANDRADTSRTGEQRLALPGCLILSPVIISEDPLLHVANACSRVRSSSPQHPEHQEILWRLLHSDTHMGGWRKLWAPTQPPASTAVHPRPCHASVTPSQHSGSAGGGVPQTGRGLHQAHEAKVRRK